MKQELVEQAITNIRDEYVLEAVEYKRSKIISFPKTPQGFVKAAAITLAIVMVGTTTAYAAATVIRKVFFTDHTVSVGNEAYVDDAGAIADAGPVEDVTNGIAQNTTYTYDSYEKACEDAKLDMWLETLPGNVDTISYSVCDDGNVVTHSIDVFCYVNGNAFSITETRFEGNYAEDMAYSIPLEHKQNVREYTNKAGIEFSLVDDCFEREEYGEQDVLMNVSVTRTYVLIQYRDRYGYLSFENMQEEEIYQILDQIIISNME